MRFQHECTSSWPQLVRTKHRKTLLNIARCESTWRLGQTMSKTNEYPRHAPLFPEASLHALRALRALHVGGPSVSALQRSRHCPLSYRHVPKLSSEPPPPAPHQRAHCYDQATHYSARLPLHPGTRATRVASSQQDAAASQRERSCLVAVTRTNGIASKVTGACRLP